MIAPAFTEEHDLFRKTLRAFIEKELAPHALEWDDAGIFPREVFTKMAALTSTSSPPCRVASRQTPCAKDIAVTPASHNKCVPLARAPRR